MIFYLSHEKTEKREKNQNRLRYLQKLNRLWYSKFAKSFIAYEGILHHKEQWCATPN